MTGNRYDYIIVGAGAAGCVLASRLSEDPAKTVLLIEAGADVPAGAEPDDIADVYAASYFNTSYFWPGLKAKWGARRHALSGFPQARIFGGGGSVMGMVALRGVRDDYDDWARAGAPGWDWDGVLPYFRKLETDRDFPNEAHGKDGPTPVRRLPREQWPPLARAVEVYGRSIGLPYVADMNADFHDGYGSVPMSCTVDRRASSAICYLTAGVRRRPNLQVMTSSRVARVLLEDRRATGVITESGTLNAHEIILTAGAIFSPALLMRSGIGPGDHLREHGIAIVHELPGVGANLQNHPILFIGVYLNPDGRQDATLRTVPALTLRWSSGLAGGATSDLYINVQSKTSWNALGLHVGNIAPSLLKPHSRGRVSLSSADADAMPRVDFNFLDDERDVARLAQGYVRAVELAHSAGVRALGGEPFALRFSDRLRRLNERSRLNAVATAMIAAATDVLPPLRGRIVDALTGDRIDLQTLVRDPQRLASHLHEHVAGVFHPAGTCRMGPADDAHAVVDTQGRVHGAQGLRVADASVMPTIVAGNTNIATIMIAEKIAAAIAGSVPG